MDPVLEQHQASPATPKKAKPPTTQAAAAPSEVKTSKVEIRVAAELLKIATEYRAECGNFRADRHEAAARTAAQDAYTNSLIAALDADQEWQAVQLEKKGGK
jgi:hypothetical protein